MSNRILISALAGGVALAATSLAAYAFPVNAGQAHFGEAQNRLAVLVHAGGGGGFGGGGHGGGFGGGHIGGAYFGGAGVHGGSMHGGHFGGRQHMSGHVLAQAGVHNHVHGGHGHGHHGHRHRVFFGGYPYFYYDDGYYDYEDDDCQWSRKYHRWVCADY